MFFAAHFNFCFLASHAAGKSNTGADALSRNNHAVFLAQVSEAAWEPFKVPSQLINLLSQNITWMCIAWMEQFSTICDLLCENHPFRHIWYFEKYHFKTLKPL